MTVIFILGALTKIYILYSWANPQPTQIGQCFAAIPYVMETGPHSPSPFNPAQMQAVPPLELDSFTKDPQPS